MPCASRPPAPISRKPPSASTPARRQPQHRRRHCQVHGNGSRQCGCRASIQALGGYGYTHEYMVEKISRDVRITIIYEGTSEIMEMTISRDRWQLHLKTRGQYYHEQARKFEALHAQHPEVGAGIAALALHALAEVMERARVGRLTRYQHILLRLGELIAYAECAGSLSRRAAPDGRRPAARKSQPPLRPCGARRDGRIFAREAALKVAQEGLRWIVGAGGVSDAGRRIRNGSRLARYSSCAGWFDLRHGFRRRRALRPRGEARAESRLVGHRLSWTGHRPLRAPDGPIAKRECHHGRHRASSYRDCGGGSHSARRAERAGLLGEHEERPLQHHGRHTGSLGPCALLRPRPQRAR